MKEYREALDLAYDWLRKIESVRILGSKERKDFGFPNHIEVWEVQTEIINEKGSIESITIHLIFTQDFPLMFPIVRLVESDFQRLKHMPHLQANRVVCTFENKVFPNPNHPEKVVEEVVRRTKSTIEIGLQASNKADYEDEFVAYWDQKFSPKDSIRDDLLLVLEKPLTKDSNIKLLKLTKPYNKISYIVHTDDEMAKRFISFINRKNITYKEYDVFFAGEIPEIKEPPFDRTNGEVLLYFDGRSKEFMQAYKKFINSKTYPKLVLFQKPLDGQINYFGWFHTPVETNRKGFRSGILTNENVMKTFSKNENVVRTKLSHYSSKRLLSRSAGFNVSPIGRIICIAGLGSIGSNLVQFLNYGPELEFRLIDEENLELENLGRHFLGLDYVNQSKVEALKDFLESKNPIQKVTIKKESVVSLVQESPEYINESDFLIVAIGENNKEQWLVHQLKKNIIKIPLMFFWVEPYLLGGHFLYVPPESPNYDSYFNGDGLYNYNIIDVSDYGNPVLTAKEAGCQSNYTPYSRNSIQIFLGQIYFWVSKVIKERPVSSIGYTWVGDTSIANDLGIRLSTIGMENKFGDVLKFEL